MINWLRYLIVRHGCRLANLIVREDRYCYIADSLRPGHWRIHRKFMQMMPAGHYEFKDGVVVAGENPLPHSRLVVRI